MDVNPYFWDHRLNGSIDIAEIPHKKWSDDTSNKDVTKQLVYTWHPPYQIAIRLPKEHEGPEKDPKDLRYLLSVGLIRQVIGDFVNVVPLRHLFERRPFRDILSSMTATNSIIHRCFHFSKPVCSVNIPYTCVSI